MHFHYGSRVLFSALMLTAVPVGGAQAQAYPSRPVELVIHSNPGAGQDVFGRLFADITSREKLLPQPFTIVNRPGGSGAVASTFIKSKKGDPHYLLSLSSTIVLALANRPDSELPLSIYTPVALFGFDLQAITVPVDSKFRNFKELVEAAKQSPDSIVNGIASATGTARFLQFQIEKMTGAKFKYVSFKSGSDAMAAVMGKHVDLTMENVSEVLSGVEAKKLRILAVPATQRLAHLPDVPTL
jgi:putative tricarboxylic transport membrane protein